VHVGVLMGEATVRMNVGSSYAQPTGCVPDGCPPGVQVAVASAIGDGVRLVANAVEPPSEHTPARTIPQRSIPFTK
jgi:hypothetical protein